MNAGRRLTRRFERRLARLVERALGTGVRPTDIFIVGYPKSGMTWMEFLLTHALLEKRAAEHVTFRTARAYVPDLSHIGPRDPLLLWRFGARRAPRVFFSHTPFDPRLLRGRVVYMLRDPRDVMVSYYHYHRRHVGALDVTLSEFVRQPAYFPCTWDVHVRGWLDGPADSGRIHVVRYEELRVRTAEVLTGLLRFTGARFTPADVARAVERSSFSRMQEIEKRFPPRVKIHDAQERFVRRGKIGGWKDELSDADLGVIEERYGAVMRWLGYAAWPTVAIAAGALVPAGAGTA